jgi:hypothetical protein
METETISIEHKYTDKEMAQLAREQSEALSEIGTLEHRLSSVKKDIAGRIDERKASLRAKSNRIASGGEYRDVRCLLLKEQPTGYQIGIRVDTARIVKYRLLRHDERQMELAEGQEPQRMVASAILTVDTKEMPMETFEVFLVQKELELLIDGGANDFTFTLLPEPETEPATA